MELLFRFLAGGILVSAFALCGNVLQPKNFAGLFGAAPSVALATLLLAVIYKDADYAAREAHSMIYGAAGFFAYACAVTWVMFHYKPPALAATLALLPIWAAVSFLLLSLAGA